MHMHRLDDWQHSHVFDQDRKQAGETRTLIVVAISAVMMVIEVVTGLTYGSMALLADGLHMASHTAALGMTALAYYVARRMSGDRRFSFGVGKINSLTGYTSAVLLLGFALVMFVESASRLLQPQAIAFNQALVIAAVGLAINALCGWILLTAPGGHSHGHEDDDGDHRHHDHDHNLRAAYLHVFTDALTSALAIVALLAGKYFGAGWLDPVMGIVGAVLVVRWSLSLVRECSGVLLDRQTDESLEQELRQAIEEGTEDRVADLHCWSIGHGIRAAELAIVSHAPASPGHYKAKIPDRLNVVHATVEVHRCRSGVA